MPNHLSFFAKHNTPLFGALVRPATKRLMLLLICLTLVACGGDPESPEQQIRNVLGLMETATQERSASGVMEHVSDDYSDHLGNTKKQIRQLVTFQILRNQKISLFSLIRSIKISGNSAEVELSLATTGREIDLSDESQRLAADVFRVSLLMKIEASQWKVSSASWQRGW